MWKFINNKSKYVIWDGVKKLRYTEGFLSNDCMVMHDNKLLSVGEVRDLVIAKGAVPTIIFACKKGQSAHEIEINGKWHGVFCHHYTEALGTPNLTYRKAIIRINELIKAHGITQICEIICRADILDKGMNMNNINRQKHVIMIYDMCRR